MISRLYEALEARRLLATFSGTVYDDPDLDGTHDAGEAPVAGRTVFVDFNHNSFPDSGEPAAVTNASGAYSLDAGTATGDLRLRLHFELFDPWGPTAPAGGQRVVTVDRPGEAHAGLDFLVSTRMVITGRVFRDSDGDGVRDADEPGLGGWTVYVDDHDHVLEPHETQTLTDADGVYRFNLDTTLAAGHFHYHVMLRRPPGWARTLPQFTDEYTVIGRPARTEAGFDYGVRPHATVAARHVFYDGSAFDAGGGGAGDDAAIATDKRALLPGDVASFANVTSYTGGINGVMFDVGGAWGSVSADDVAVTTGREGDPAGWADAPAPAVTVRPGAGAGGSDRVTLAWAGGAVKNAWLRVTVKANADTGLLADDVFSFGNLVGETGDSDGDFRVSALDLAAVKRALGRPSDVTGRFDFDRDGRVNALDVAALKQSLGRTLPPPLPPPTPPPLQVDRVWDDEQM